VPSAFSLPHPGIVLRSACVQRRKSYSRMLISYHVASAWRTDPLFPGLAPFTRHMLVLKFLVDAPKTDIM
jgi:hypothetical protein